MAASKPDIAAEKREQKADAELSPLGKRTLAGFVKRYGEEQGEQKFQSALNNGTLDRAKMESEAADEGSADDENTEFTGAKPPAKKR